MDDPFNPLETNHLVSTKSTGKSMGLAYLKGESIYSAIIHTYPFNLAMDEPTNDNLIASMNRVKPIVSNQRQDI